MSKFKEKKDYVVLTVEIDVKDEKTIIDILTRTNKYFKLDSFNSGRLVLKYRYEFNHNNNTKEQFDILSDNGTESLYTIKSSLPFELAVEGGLLDCFVSKYNALIKFECFVFPDENEIECCCPLLFYPQVIDFIKRLNAYLFIWPRP